MKNRFDLIIFDWDGTLVDSIDWIVQSLCKAAEVSGCTVPDEQAVKNIIGLSLEKSTDTLFPTINQKTKQQLMTCYSQEFFSKQVSKNDLFVGINNMLVELKQKGFQLAVATGKNKVELDKAMQGTGLSGFFDITRCADQTASKPQPDMLDEIIEHTGVRRERAVMVGDSIHDLKMAMNAGIASIAVLCGANSQDQLQQFNPLLNLQHTTQILDIL
ncbi:MAG: HAD-IA family hydrolase [Methylococcales bacterium]|nr:HAD-IA family hydrolase [Methylococcales bacterium]